MGSKLFENTKAKIVFESLSQKEGENYKSIIGNFIVQDSNGKIENLSPELRIYNQPNITTSEADIKTTLLSDKFIVINLVQNQEFFNVRYQVKPFMLWIWISVILISFGGLISFVKKDMKNKLIPLSIFFVFIIIFIIFYKGLQNTNIYTPNSKSSFEYLQSQLNYLIQMK